MPVSREIIVRASGGRTQHYDELIGAVTALWCLHSCMFALFTAACLCEDEGRGQVADGYLFLYFGRSRGRI